ncbi:hypothetical protein OFO01_08665 [Campylobacter sp. JMF_01 NE2]|uniref:hypothetical protein n=1 Tax=unclassified Campylobacter TaxID=2593542 RepID=UPI0022E9B43D|nr:MULTISPECIES: hypothetical protein [unclassified Campylobacter]MDA3053651.1 hypothetical protein [Campylobacter sp. JMF_03 NE3]MDA3067853.1 hypothetical protein [Campylobacter sp. JMF_01 NE2]
MDILIVNLIVAFACALCIKYIANSQINKFAKFFTLLFFFVFVFFGFFVFVFFLTLFFLALITKKHKVKINTIDDKLNYEKIEISKDDKFLFQNKTHFVATLITLFLTYGFLFDGFKILKFRYECDIKKNFKIEILDNNYALSDLQNIRLKDSEIYHQCNNDYAKCPKNTGLIHKSDIYINDKKIGKVYRYFMPYNSFMHKFLSVSTDVQGLTCHNMLDTYEIINILEQNLINKNSNGKDKR